MKGYRRYAIICSLVLLLTFASVAFAPQEARAVATSYVWIQVKALRTKVASVVAVNRSQASSISSLGSRIGRAEATETALSGRVAGVESSSATILGTLGNMSDAIAVLTGRMTAVETSQAAIAARLATLEAGSGGGDFWPASTEPTITIKQAIAAPEGFEVVYSLVTTDIATGIPLYNELQMRRTKLTVGDKVFINGIDASGRAFGAVYDPTTLPSGTPVVVEEWLELQDGRQLHYTSTLTEWEWMIP